MNPRSPATHSCFHLRALSGLALLLALPVLAVFGQSAATPPPSATAAPATPTPAPTTPPADSDKSSLPAGLADQIAQFTSTTGIKLVLIPAGKFTMGDAKNKPAHQVTLTQPFYLGATTVTQAQWFAVMATSPSHFKGDTLPVERVSWDEARAFCKKLTEQETAAKRLPPGWAYTLPTEAQFEYACRAGTTGDYAGDISKMAWYDSLSASTTHPVGTKLPNAWGLYDMNGNVWQWCQDWFGDYSADDVTDPTGPATGVSRVLRGGSWTDGSEYCTSTKRDGEDHNFRFYYFGFRLALAPSAPHASK